MRGCACLLKISDQDIYNVPVTDAKSRTTKDTRQRQGSDWIGLV